MTVLGAPRVMVLSLRPWLGAPRLPKAFARAGFEVHTLSYRNSPLCRSRYSNRQFFLPDLPSDEALIAATRAVLVEQRPTLVVPTDDSSVELLQAVAATARRELPESDPLLQTLRDSLGDFGQHAVLRQRYGLAQLAAEIGVRAPAFAVIHDRPEALAFAAQNGFPVVLKAEESVAGMGVSICKDEAELDAALTRHEAFNPRLFREGTVLQSFVSGPTALRAVLAWRGQVLGGLSAIKRETHPHATGPSSVVEFIEQPEMMRTAQAMVRALGFSGFASLDFILDESGSAHLIELNARPTPICHLGHYLGRDLCQALRDALDGKAVVDCDPPGLPKKVALFPQEWVRDQSSPHFAHAFHDVPWDEPDLVEAFVLAARSQMRGSEWRREEDRRDRLRQLLTRLAAPGA